MATRRALLVFICDRLHGWEVEDSAHTLLIRPPRCKHEKQRATGPAWLLPFLRLALGEWLATRSLLNKWLTHVKILPGAEPTCDVQMAQQVASYSSCAEPAVTQLWVANRPAAEIQAPGEGGGGGALTVQGPLVKQQLGRLKGGGTLWPRTPHRE